MRISDWSSDVCSSDLLAGEVPQELLQGRIIVVGATASGLASRYSMSMGTVMPGIKIQAHLLQGLLDKQMIAKAGIFACLTIALIPLWLFMVYMGLFPRIPSLFCLAVLTALVMVCAAGALILFRILIPPAAAVAGLSIAYPLWGWRQLAITQAYMCSELEGFEAEPPLLPDLSAASKPVGIASAIEMRSEERRGGKECVSKCKSRG